jgi:hypothetical protein
MTEPEKRQEFIRAHFEKYGWINSKPVEANFDVGYMTARNDVYKFTTENESLVFYNNRTRRYERVK